MLADIDYLALALALIPPVAVPVACFCAARLPLPQIAAAVTAATPAAPLLFRDPLDALLLLGPGDCLDWLCTDLVPSASASASVSASPSASPSLVSSLVPSPSRVLTIARVFSRQNNKLVLLCKISYPSAPGWRQEATLVVAKLRLRLSPDAWREHDNELAMLRAVGASCSRAMFPRLLAIGQFAGRRPMLLMSYIPHPSLTDILRGSVGDKTVFHNDAALRSGLERAVRALRGMGLRHDDLKGANVVYRVGTGRVWLVDMESVAGLMRQTALPGETEKAGDERAVQEILTDFWKYELCCADGGCRQSR